MCYDCSVRVSNELGAAHPRVAKLSVFVVNGNSIIISVVLAAIIMIFRVALSKLFTSDTVVLEAVSDLTPLLAISVLLNGIQPILSGNQVIIKTNTSFGFFILLNLITPYVSC
jgi:MATE family multidrug resistance protein